MKKTLVIGPSHVVRWANAIKNNILPEIDNVDFYGKTGAPIWSDFLQKKEKDFNKYEEIIIFVGDFRLGNKFLLDNSNPKNQYGIDKESINIEVDRSLYKKVLDKCNDIIKSNKKNNIKLIFWSLSGRENKNKKKKSYIIDGVYKHPIWNLSEIEKKFKKENVISMQDVNCDNFFIDESNHPSYQGYSFLYSVFFGKKTVVQDSIDIDSLSNKNTIICGDSKFIKTINDYIDLNIISGEKKIEIGLNKVESLLKNVEKDKKVIFFSNVRSHKGNDDLFLKRINKILNLKEKFKNIEFVLWEAFAQEILSERNRPDLVPKNALFQHEKILMYLSLNNSYFPNSNSYEAQCLIEMKEHRPTVFGIIWGLMYSLGDIEKYKMKKKDLEIRL